MPPQWMMGFGILCAVLGAWAQWDALRKNKKSIAILNEAIAVYEKNRLMLEQDIRDKSFLKAAAEITRKINEGVSR